MPKGREHLPSPVKHRILWSSPLIGMERPVRSFRSFILTVPPNPGIEQHKPLPPIPPALTISQERTPIQLPLPPPPPDTANNFTLWQATTEWDWDVATPHAQNTSTTSILPNRKYLPLLPEPSPGLYDMQGNFPAGIVDAYDTQRGPLKSDHDTREMRPEPPPRNPSRMSMPAKGSKLSGSDTSATSVPNDNQSSLSPSIYNETRLGLPEEAQVDTTTWAHPHFRASDASTKAKAFASLGIGSPRNSKNVWEDWASRPEASKADADSPPLLVLHGKNIQPLAGDDLPAPVQAVSAVLNEKLEQLSFSQDYHNVLAHRYDNDYSQPPEMSIHPAFRTTTTQPDSTARPQPSQREQDMVPRPLAWSKSSGSSFSSDYSQRRPSETEIFTFSGPKVMHKKMPSWIPLQHVHSSERGQSNQQKTSPDIAPRTPTRDHTSKSTLPNKSSRLPNFLAHAKSFGHRRNRSGSDSPTSNVHTSSHQQSHAITEKTLANSPQSPTPQRLPGGSTLAHNLSSDILRSNTAPVSKAPPSSINTRLPDLYTGSQSPHGSGFRRPSSLYSQPSSASPVIPGVAVKNRFRYSIGSLPSPRRHSRTSSQTHTLSPPTSPLATEVFSPRTPPPPLPTNHPRPHQMSPTTSPISASSGRRQYETFFGDKTPESSPQRSGFWDKAKDVRAAWKRNQKECKHEKLKQSIRVVVPMDTAGTERRSNRKASVFEESESDRCKLAGEYEASNVI